MVADVGCTFPTSMVSAAGSWSVVSRMTWEILLHNYFQRIGFVVVAYCCWKSLGGVDVHLLPKHLRNSIFRGHNTFLCFIHSDRNSVENIYLQY